MNLSAQEITSQLLMLPEQEQQEVLDFIALLKNKLDRGLLKSNKYKGNLDTPSAQEMPTVPPIYRAFEQAGLSCIETDEQFSITYKEKLDFSFKHGIGKR
ncbi:DUF2281 domain-containing protein [Methylovulum psychrotolerans]|uniref:Uncharacterized protein n=1 Tax=Methylovulum psychrotolerans TaxID=1704499 RepID=A0A2S5CH47_9GAMM|nr:DUF2281 domain-containing protein [Methylovulum psychrotolerans]POZ50114.1 hypothetical protein AADEFJLK_04133 [Methylovulum psychrotolerans]